MKLLLAGLVSPRGLGDQLQYVVGTYITRKRMPNAKLTLFIPTAGTDTIVQHLKDLIYELVNVENEGDVEFALGFQELSSVANLVKTLIGNSMIRYSHSIKGFEKAKTGFHIRKALNTNLVGKIAGLCLGKYYESGISVFYVRPAICRLLSGLRYDGGFIGGHTIEYSAFFDYLITYNCARTVVKGPLLTYPISVSHIGIRYREKHLDKLKKSLNSLDAIFVRGKYSYATLRKLVNEDRVFMALDAGFGIKLLYRDLSVTGLDKELTVGIVPRKEYFYFYRLELMYLEYLKTLKRLIEMLIKEFEAKVVLIPHSLKSFENSIDISDERAISDLLNILDYSVKSRVKVVKPLTILDSVKVFSSCDTVITSRLHAGVISLAYGIPTIFFMPKDDVKVLDVLSYLSLDEERYIVEIFNPKEYGKLFLYVKSLIHSLSQERNVIENIVNKHLSDVEKPVVLLKKLLY